MYGAVLCKFSHIFWMLQNLSFITHTISNDCVIRLCYMNFIDYFAAQLKSMVNINYLQLYLNFLKFII